MKTQDNIQIENGLDLSNLDFKTLSLFYMPIIGIEAFSLYNVLLNLVNYTNKKNYQVIFLLDLLNIKLANFNNAREKLEAINLIETYENSRDQFTIYLKSPYKANQFIKDTMLGSYVQSEIGDNNMMMLLSLFKTNQQETTGKNISKQFDDLYKFSEMKLIDFDYDLQGRADIKKINVSYAFDLEKFVKLLPEKEKTTNLLKPNYKEQLVKIAYVYNLTEEELAIVFEKAPRKTIPSVHLQAKTYFEQNKKKIVVTKKEDDNLFELKNATIDELLAGRVDELYEGQARKTYFEITEKFENVDLGVIHVLIVNLLNIKDGVLPNTTYLSMVLNDWISKDVVNAQDALNLINGIKLENNRTNKYYPKTNKTVKKADWMDEYIERIKNKG